MIPTLLKRSFRDMTRKKARSFFLMATISLGVLGLSLTAVVPLGNRAVSDKIEQENMHNIKITIQDIEINDTVLTGLSDLENVKDVEARIEVYCRMYIRERRNWALFVGKDDIRDQKVDRFILSSGQMPGNMEVLTDEANDMNGIYSGSRGDEFDVIGPDGNRSAVRISGKGKNLMASGETMDGVAVFYSSSETVRAIGGSVGFNVIALTLNDTNEDSMKTTIESIRQYLERMLPVVAFSDLPELRPEGHYQGKDTLEQFGDFFMIFTVLIMVCSVFLIANTMNTMISEQTKEVAQMKAIGATRADIFVSFLQTSFMIGAIGSVVGAILGIFMAQMVLVQFAKPFGFDPDFGVNVPTVLFSIAAGTLIALIASVPALYKAVRIDILKALGNRGIDTGLSLKAVEKGLMGIKGLPRSAQMGIRNINRKPGRSIATILQISMSVGVIIALTFLGSSVFDAVQGNWRDQRWDLAVYSNSGPEKPINLSIGQGLIGTIPGIERIEPILMSEGVLKGNSAQIYGMVRDTWSLDYSVTLLEKGKGRWWTEEEEANGSQVVILGYAISQFTGVGLGDQIDLMTATGEYRFTVIGIDDTNWDDGDNFRMPITTLQRTLRVGDAVSGFYVRTGPKDHASIDRLSEEIYQALEEAGYSPEIGVHYILEEEDRIANSGVMDMIFAIGSVIVLISLLGLTSTLTMNMLDRTKEIGMLRCLGAKASTIVSVFSTEGAFISFIGWLMGVPIGLGLYTLLLEMVHDVMKITLHWSFSPSYLLASFLITVIGTVLVMLLPLSRAIGFRPGEALRYE